MFVGLREALRFGEDRETGARRALRRRGERLFGLFEGGILIAGTRLAGILNVGSQLGFVGVWRIDCVEWQAKFGDVDEVHRYLAFLY